MLVKCPDCDYMYISDDIADKSQHRKFHADTINGISMRPLVKENTIWSKSDERIFVVSSHSSRAEKVRARKIVGMANNDCDGNCGLIQGV